MFTARQHAPFLVRWTLALAACGIALSGCQREQPTPLPAPPKAVVTPEAAQAAETITAEFLRERIAVLSADEFGGRAPASEGDEKARRYLVEQLQELGFAPAGPDGTWQQAFDIVGITSKMPSQWRFTRDGRSVSFPWREAYVATSGVQQARAGIDDAEVVFVGYGIQAPEYQWDDFKGRDLRGKVLLMLNNDPDWDPALFEGERRLYYGRWTYKYESAARQGAVGAIIVHTTESAGYPFQVVQTSWTGQQFELPAEDEPRLTVQGWLTEEASRELVALAGRDLDELIAAARSREFEPVPLGITTSLAFTNEITRTRTANVYGVLRGSDPRYADEYVIYTAHHDHLGIGEPDASGDRIHNGARDNASGTAQVLAIGKSFQRLQELGAAPRRSIMLLFVGAEEQGLLGSRFYADHPTVAPGRIAANINYDSANIWGRTRDVAFVGMGKSTLDPIVQAFAAEQGRVVTPDPFPDRGYFYRSDQFHFARIGVPAMYLKPGTDFIGRPAGWGKARVEEHEANQYHQPSDELDDSWNFEGMIEDAQLGFWVGLHIANAPALPEWLPGDEFEAARKQALSAVQSE